MSIQCLRTGADVYLSEYGAIAHGDLFLISNVYVLNTKGCEEWSYVPMDDAKFDLIFNRVERVGSAPVLLCKFEQAEIETRL